MVEGGPPVDNIELQRAGEQMPLVSSERQGGSPKTKKRNKKDKKKSKQKSKSKGAMKSVAASAAIIMKDDEIEEHAEAMDMIECPHKVQISLSCRNIADMDLGGKSDPYAIIYAKAEKE